MRFAWEAWHAPVAHVRATLSLDLAIRLFMSTARARCPPPTAAMHPLLGRLEPTSSPFLHPLPCKPVYPSVRRFVYFCPPFLAPLPCTASRPSLCSFRAALFSHSYVPRLRRPSTSASSPVFGVLFSAGAELDLPYSPKSTLGTWVPVGLSHTQ